MSKARSTGNLNNSILISDTGAITFVSGSTTLASLSTTGQLSGSAPALSASYAATASYATNFNVSGTITATTLVVQTITSSVDYVTGSTRFGSLNSNTHVFSGSVTMNPNGLFVSSSGYIGLNKVAPQRQYTQVANTNGIVFTIQNAAASNEGLIVGFDTTGSTYLQLSNSANSAGVYLNSSGSSYIIGGSVGIGTTSPGYTLDVNTSNTNSVFAATTTFTHSGGYLDHSAFLAPNMTGGALSVSFGKSASNYNTGKFVFNYTGNNSTSNSIGLGFYNADNLLVVKGDGKVGIGTTSPSLLLHVNGQAQINGLGVNRTLNAGWGTYSAIEMHPYSSIFAGDDGYRAYTAYAFGVYSGAGWSPKYILSNSYVQAYRQRDGAHEFLTAAGGTAGTDITFTQPMTIANTGYVGIGTSSPSFKLDILQGSPDIFRVTNNGSATGNNPSAQFYHTHGNHSWGILAEFRIGTSGGTDRPSILFSSGYDTNTWGIGFGYNDSSYFRINKDQGPYGGGWGSNLFSMDRSGNYSFSGSNVSDRRNKKNITYITDSQLETLLKLKPASFNKKSPGRDEYSDHVHTGFIAQDVLEENIPNLVHGNEEEGYGLDYDGILALAVKAIQELKAENDTLKEILQRNNIQ